MKTCLDCAEEVQDEANVCRYCGHRFDVEPLPGYAIWGRRPRPEPDLHGQMKICPDCAEQVQDAAKVCRYCGYRFEREDQRSTSRRSAVQWGVALVAAVVLGLVVWQVLLVDEPFADKFEVVNRGDSKDQVADKIGSPDFTQPRWNGDDTTTTWWWEGDDDDYTAYVIRFTKDGQALPPIERSCSDLDALDDGRGGMPAGIECE